MANPPPKRWPPRSEMNATGTRSRPQIGSRSPWLRKSQTQPDEEGVGCSNFKIGRGNTKMNGVAFTGQFGNLNARPQNRVMPLRPLFARVPNRLVRFKPCWMMSPLAVSTSLESPEFQFDVVIFDVASQMLPWDAIGAVDRGRQLVVARDQKQLPPTMIFDRMVNDGDVQNRRRIARVTVVPLLGRRNGCRRNDKPTSPLKNVGAASDLPLFQVNGHLSQRHPRASQRLTRRFSTGCYSRRASAEETGLEVQVHSHLIHGLDSERHASNRTNGHCFSQGIAAASDFADACDFPSS